MGQYRQHHPLMASRPAVLALIKTFFAAAAYAAPTSFGILENIQDADEEGEDADVWVLLIASIFLVLLGGAFAGLTIALMGQDSIYLQVIAKDPTDPQQKNAKRVFQLLEKGKHWVLVTLLLSNVIVNETLPVVLDRCLGGGVAAVVGSTVLIVIFGEVVPQSVCVRYGLAIGGYMSGPVLLLMYLMAPLAWPTAKLLDWALGEDHGTVYKKSGLKTLVTLHRTLGEASERLNEDEVTIIGAVLDLKGKPVHAVMTPMDDVFVMAEDTVLDQEMIDMILSAGYSRIPIHEASNPTNFIGMLLVKILITYDPEDCKRVRDFPLATLPETRPETSCLDIINFFQEGKSHMVLVSESPGDDHGALGVVTLEDVIEELIGEEIIDESDVYIDVHKAIRRMAPAPKARYRRRLSTGKPVLDAGETNSLRAGEEYALENEGVGKASYNSVTETSQGPERSGSPATATLLLRRSSAGLDGRMENVPVRANFDDIKQHLKYLGPSNPASNPKATRSTTVKIKPRHQQDQPQANNTVTDQVIPEAPHDAEEEEGDETTSLLRGGMVPKDGTHALAQSYGATGAGDATTSNPDVAKSLTLITGANDAVEQEERPTQTSAQSNNTDFPTIANSPFPELRTGRSSSSGSQGPPSDSLGPYGHRKGLFARSGSITEQVIEPPTGIKKTVLEMTEASAEDEDQRVHQAANRSDTSLPSSAVRGVENGHQEATAGSAADAAEDAEPADDNQNGGSNSGKKKNRRKKRKGKS